MRCVRILIVRIEDTAFQAKYSGAQRRRGLAARAGDRGGGWGPESGRLAAPLKMIGPRSFFRPLREISLHSYKLLRTFLIRELTSAGRFGIILTSCLLCRI